MDKALTRDLHELAALLERTKTEAQRFLGELDRTPAAVKASEKTQLELPSEGLGAEKAFNLFLDRYGKEMGGCTGPRYFGFVQGGSTPAALAGDWMASALDQNPFSPGSSAAPQVELETLKLLRELLGLPDSFFGSFVSGATMSNFVGLASARQWVARQRGVDVAKEGLYGMKPISVLSALPHSSTLKSLSMLGMGRGCLVKVPCLPGRESVDLAALQARLEALGGEPCIVVASAGTVNTGDYDDLEAMGRLKERHSFWLHIDGAFGGFAACSPRFAHLTRGMELADSLTVDAHKWLNVPYDSALQFTRHPELLHEVFRNGAAYLDVRQGAPSFADMGPENSRRFRALPAWLTLMAYGRTGYQDIIERNCQLARELGARIEGSGAFRLLAPVRLNIACFTLRRPEQGPSQEEVRAFLDRLRDDGRVFLTPTVYDGVQGIRAAISNWRTTPQDIDIAWAAMTERVSSAL
ncbi:MAG TPA: pyridoxal-dependent decarboxylase [Archangium sp.]|uniref:pyridoxal phosphate-dependent decarboxylase family protein n=1 Tax=Archangium sp. TaxID=1872627 RepID=UPI002E36C8D9|nr:pyridoxal-dependent decarboxylase [Archangium sp.]HEX5752707.1 pyridoxal-dependent decarboxylase [Archangium sp.]